LRRRGTRIFAERHLARRIGEPGRVEIGARVHLRIGHAAHTGVPELDRELSALGMDSLRHLGQRPQIGVVEQLGRLQRGGQGGRVNVRRTDDDEADAAARPLAIVRRSHVRQHAAVGPGRTCRREHHAVADPRVANPPFRKQFRISRQTHPPKGHTLILPNHIPGISPVQAGDPEKRLFSYKEALLLPQQAARMARLSAGLCCSAVRGRAPSLYSTTPPGNSSSFESLSREGVRAYRPKVSRRASSVAPRSSAGGPVKLIRYAHASGPRVAQLHGGRVADPIAIDEALGLFDAPTRRSLAGMDTIIAGGADARRLIERARLAAEARALALP